ncbi:MAG: hypothetical protein R3E14_06505 [Erythrobacter sp.]
MHFIFALAASVIAALDTKTQITAIAQIMITISQKRFDALAGYTRLPAIVLIIQEAGWFATDDERLLGLITWDRFDRDYGWIVLGRDGRGRFRAIDQDVSLPSFDDARERLAMALDKHAALPDESYHQGDEQGVPLDFFTPIVADDRINKTFKTLSSEERYSPARELIGAMMPFFEDADGNFVEQFQTTGFDPRLWELYLFATFTELGYAHEEGVAVPDLLLSSPAGCIAIEATTANPPQVGAAPDPKTDAEMQAYLENYVQIKLARALTRKLYHKQRYWDVDGVDGAPFVIALQDFHAPAAMTRIVPLAAEYLFGVRHSIVDGARKIERLEEHVYGNAREASNFFGLPEAENVSAVLLNPQGTITKFNRLGYIAGFGNRDVHMVRSGIARGELNSDDPRPTDFCHDVRDPEYSESWIEGAVVLHNPNARIPLDPDLIPGAAHEFLQTDGSIMSLLPDFQPYMSRTSITLGSESSENDDTASVELGI